MGTLECSDGRILYTNGKHNTYEKPMIQPEFCDLTRSHQGSDAKSSDLTHTGDYQQRRDFSAWEMPPPSQATHEVYHREPIYEQLPIDNAKIRLSGHGASDMEPVKSAAESRKFTEDGKTFFQQPDGQKYCFADRRRRLLATQF